MATDQKLAYTTVEVLKKLPLSRSALYDGIRKGIIPTKRIGKTYLIPAQFVDSFYSVDSEVKG